MFEVVAGAANGPAINSVGGTVGTEGIGSGIPFGPCQTWFCRRVGAQFVVSSGFGREPVAIERPHQFVPELVSDRPGPLILLIGQGDQVLRTCKIRSVAGIPDVGEGDAVTEFVVRVVPGLCDK